MNPTKSDTLATRLVQILVKLNNGEALCARELAEEFNVSVRTIQRDLKHFESLLLKEVSLFEQQGFKMFQIPVAQRGKPLSPRAKLSRQTKP